MKDNNREMLGSRLGFLLVSAGCAIGLGNIWRFPFITGQNGGAAFVMVYLLFLLILGLPILVMEYAMGRAGRLNIAGAMRRLEPANTRWHIFGYLGIAGNVILMMFYTTVAGWGLAYFFYTAGGAFSALGPSEVGTFFESFLTNTLQLVFWMSLVVVSGFFICSRGLQAGVERAGKSLMGGLFIILILLVLRSVTLPGAAAGIDFYLKPDFSVLDWKAVYAAIGQAFFTLSVGLGGMTIFGSYMNKERALAGEAVHVLALDTTVALLAGLVIFPAAFAFGIGVDFGPGLIFITLPNIFNHMVAGRFWGSLFFLFLSFASLSTVIAVFENILAFSMDEFGWNRKKASLRSAVVIFILSLPCALSFGPLAGVQIAGKGILDIEDFILSNNLLPIGALSFLLFCTVFGWGWENFIREANTGDGIKFPTRARTYVSYVLPIIILLILIKGWL